MEDREAASDAEIRNGLRQVLIAQDNECKLWSKKEVERARNGFARLGGIPSYEGLCQSLGKERVDATLNDIIQQRIEEQRFHATLQANGDPCHGCGATEGLSHHDFGLVRITKRERDWKSVGISAAISAVTIPLVGAGALYGPSKTATGHVLKMRLALCVTCKDQRKGLFGTFSVRERDGTIHPLWNDLHAAGFTKFLSAVELTKWH
jgi:hypothetical protein